MMVIIFDDKRKSVMIGSVSDFFKYMDLFSVCNIMITNSLIKKSEKI